MLDYEHQCYKQRVDIVHARLTALQDAARTRVGAAHRELLDPQPPSRCEPSQPAAGLSPTAAREATLDAERQCYKQLEASERQKLTALQDAVRKSYNAAPAQRGPAPSQRGAAPSAPRDPYVTY